MGRYRVTGSLSITIVKTIEADSFEEAREKAEDLAVPGLCWSCADAGSKDSALWELSGELDGTSQILEVTEED